MREAHIESVYHCDPERFWDDFYFHADYGQRIYVQGLGFTRWELLEQTADDQRIVRKVALEKPLPPGLPGPVRKLLGETTTFIEHGEFDRRTREYHLTLTSDRIGSRGEVRGVIRVAPHPDGCLRKATLQATARIVALGGRVEKVLIDAFSEGYRDAVPHGNAWLAERKVPASTTVQDRP